MGKPHLSHCDMFAWVPMSLPNRMMLDLGCIEKVCTTAASAPASNCGGWVCAASQEDARSKQ